MRKKIIFFTFIFSLFSCETWDYFNTDEFDYGTNNYNVNIFIDGGISSQYINHVLYLTKPGSYIDNSKQEPVKNARVYIVCENDTFNYELVEYDWREYEQQFFELETPYYQSIEKFSAIPGKQYVLYVEYNNKLYSAADLAPEATDFKYDEIPLPYKNENPNESYSDDNGNIRPAALDLSVKKHHFGFPYSCVYLWAEKENISDSDNFITSIYAKSYAHQFADVQGVFANINYYTHFIGGDVSIKDTAVTILQTISAGYYNYLRQGFNETDWKESTFATISGNLPTNVSEGGAGFFYVSDLFKKEIIIEDLLNYDLN
ncbi:MAG: hypothetical protein JXA77_19610 [Bacteroidales bacterium]|nr:hypothetical protein [Bacteroidales bacterium]